MSREIDLTKKLSKADRAYLQNHNRLTDILVADGDLGPDGFLPMDSITDSHEQSPDQSDASLGAQTANPEERTLPGSQDVSPPSESDDGEGSQDGDNYDDEDAWSYKDLQEEAKGRADVSAGGSREELIVALRADDQKPVDQG